MLDPQLTAAGDDNQKAGDDNQKVGGIGGEDKQRFFASLRMTNRTFEIPSIGGDDKQTFTFYNLPAIRIFAHSNLGIYDKHQEFLHYCAY